MTTITCGKATIGIVKQPGAILIDSTAGKRTVTAT